MKSRLSLLAGMLLIGSFVVVNKQIVAQVPVFIASEFRLAVGGLCFLALLWLRRDSVGRLQRSDLPLVFIQALVGVVLFSIFALNGLKFTSAINAGIIMGMTPVAILFLAFAGRKDSLDRWSIVSALLACCGAVVLNASRSGSVGPGSREWLGNLLIFLAMLGEAVFVSAGNFTRRPLHPLLLSTSMACAGALMFLPLAVGEYGAWSASSVSSLTWAYMIYTGIGITVVGVFLMNYGASRVPMSTAATFSAFIPASSCVLAIGLLGERAQAAHVVGLMLIVSGAMITSWRKPNASPLALSP